MGLEFGRRRNLETTRTCPNCGRRVEMPEGLCPHCAEMSLAAIVKKNKQIKKFEKRIFKEKNKIHGYEKKLLKFTRILKSYIEHKKINKLEHITDKIEDLEEKFKIHEELFIDYLIKIEKILNKNEFKEIIEKINFSAKKIEECCKELYKSCKGNDYQESIHQINLIDSEINSLDKYLPESIKQEHKKRIEFELKGKRIIRNSKNSFFNALEAMKNDTKSQGIDRFNR